ncbi:hypothetical protein WR25_25642 isoform B [Diploscapter pachys]|uniref:Glutathione S-transferase kappa n=1 Tax=Diploscapter pachys TaxID=2018661 RepID=A0A2A2KKZ7_9BILA|nr:hypothetical protein WR25_25642 isoform A [Diploscapter pachys]PAV74642.1 hypothetical protein WR25_25642 isoform B [Diploscapter pachys]
MPPKFKIEFFYDLFSPYSYLGFEALHRYASFWGDTAVVLRPLWLGAVFKSVENAQTPAANPFKAKNLKTDFELNAKYWGLGDLRLPNDFQKLVFTKPSIYAMRILIAARQRDEKLLLPLTRAFYLRFFQENKGIFEEQDFQEVLKQCKIPDYEAILEAQKSQQVKDELAKNINDAVQSECFGAPWHLIYDSNGKLIGKVFGSDRMHIISMIMGKQYLGPNPEKPFSKL